MTAPPKSRAARERRTSANDAAPGEAEAPAEASVGSRRRRGVFFDVENSSRVEHIAHMLEHLELGTLSQEIQLQAVGNWRVVGQETARLLSRHGATLVHSAPAFGVKDWSDLRIAVAAGAWLAQAMAGDELVIITDDQAFDAVGDVAATKGIMFRRISFRALAKQGRGSATGTAEVNEQRRGTRRGSRPRRTGATSRRPLAPVARGAEGAAAHAAPHDEVLSVVRGLIERSPDGAVTLDAVGAALQARGFRRPPGSLRLITRLRQMDELDVSQRGTIRLRASAD